jgi:acetolactate synthase-1/2/3 large subunit
LKGYEVIVDILQREGINHVGLFPGGGGGGTLGQIVNECSRQGIRPVTARKERVALNIADGFARASGGVGVALVTHGVGAENAFSGLSQAHSDHVPLLLISGDAPLSSLGHEGTQDFDYEKNYNGITKWVSRIYQTNQIPYFFRRAFTYLRSGTTAPVCLAIPRDVTAGEMMKSFHYQKVREGRMGGDPEDVREGVKKLLSAENPVLYGGEGVFYAQGWRELRVLSELLQIPVITSMKAKGVMPEDHPLSLGCGGRGGTKPAAYFLDKADLVFAIGASLTVGPGMPVPRNKTLIHSTNDPLEMNKNYPTDYFILGDSKIVLNQVIEEVKKSGKEERVTDEGLVKEIAGVKEDWIREWLPKLTSDEEPINPYRLIWDLMHTVDRSNSIITADAGWPRDFIAPFWETLTPRGYIGWGHHSTMGFSLGSAMGAKLAEPDKLVINYIGDGSFGMVGMDFETAVREKIPILTIMTNNVGLGHYYHDVPSVAYLGGNYAKVAEGLGGYGERIEEPDEIKEAIQRGIDSTEEGRPALLEFMTSLEEESHQKYWTELRSEI